MSPTGLSGTFLTPLKLLAELWFKIIALIRGLQLLKHLTSMHGPLGKAGTPPPNPRWAHNICRLCGLLCFRAVEPVAFLSSCSVSSVMLTGSSHAEMVVFITHSFNKTFPSLFLYLIVKITCCSRKFRFFMENSKKKTPKNWKNWHIMASKEEENTSALTT